MTDLDSDCGSVTSTHSTNMDGIGNVCCLCFSTIIGFYKTLCHTVISSILRLIKLLFIVWQKRGNVHIDGFVEPGFEKVAGIFRKNLSSGGERGAAFSVYHKGRLVVDIWGGYSDKAARRLWREDTLSLWYSATKAVTAIVIGMLVDRGVLDYDEPVCKYWPEFAENGKRKITVKMLLSHQAGLVNVRDSYTLSLVRDDPELLGRILAKQKPEWRPGKATGYHAITYGLYADQLIRRVDPLRRSLAQFFHDELAKPYDLDMHIGLPKEHHHRTTRNNQVGIFGLRYIVTIFIPTSVKLSYRFLRAVFTQGNTHHSRFLGNPRDLKMPNFNNPDFRELGIGSSHGFGTARALAKLFGILANGGEHGGERILSQRIIDRLKTPESEKYDDVLLNHVSYGPGTQLLERKHKNGDPYYVFGHWGLGGQMAYSDTDKKLGWAYVTNYNNLLHGFITDHRYAALQNAMYECVETLEANDQ